MTDTEQARLAGFSAEVEDQRRLARHEDFVFDKSQEAYWDVRNGTLHSEKGIDSAIPRELWRSVAPVPETPPEGEGLRAPGRAPGRPPREQLVPPSRDVMRVENDLYVEGSTWWPGMPQFIKNLFIDDAGSRPSKGCRILNLYRAPPEAAAEVSAEAASVWVEHVKKLWPDPREHTYFFNYCAHMLQHPEEKANAAIVLSGAQRIGKDAALFPVRAAVGDWNVKNIDPDDLFSQFKPWVQTLMLVVNEVRPTKDEFHASSMYNILKPLIAAPPDMLPLNDKNRKLRYVVNVMRVFMTTNNWLSMYIPSDDHRMFIMHSTLPKLWHAASEPEYFSKLFRWYKVERGCECVAAWLRARDLSTFDPKAAPTQTEGWQAITSSWDEPEDGVRFALETLKWPDVVFGSELADPQFDGYEEVMNLLKSPRKIVQRMARSGYRQGPLATAVEGAGVEDGRWVFRSGSSGKFRSRLVFLKESAQIVNGSALKMIVERGRSLAVGTLPRHDDLNLNHDQASSNFPLKH